METETREIPLCGRESLSKLVYFYLESALLFLETPSPLCTSTLSALLPVEGAYDSVMDAWRVYWRGSFQFHPYPQLPTPYEHNSVIEWHSLFLVISP